MTNDLATLDCSTPLTDHELCGTVRAILFRDESDGYAIARVAVRAAAISNGSAQPTDRIVRGPLDSELSLGTAYRFFGRWEDHPKHGPQFLFSTFTRDMPLNRAGVIKYLAETAANIGRTRAAALWDAFGERCIEVLRTSPAEVVSAGILNDDQADEAARTLAELDAVEKTRIDLFGLFDGYGFHGALIKRCIQLWGARAPEIIRRNPFTLLVRELPSAGFKRCDKLYCDLGLNPTRLKRQFLSLWNALRNDDAGHTWLLAARACQNIARDLGRQCEPVKAARLGKRAQWIASRRDERGQVWLAESAKARDEFTVSECVKNLLRAGPAHWPAVPADSPLSDHQREKLAALSTGRLAVLAGSPGVGKTFCAAVLMHEVCRIHGATNVQVCAPTGKAAVRITQAMRQHSVPLIAATIHQTLEVGRNGHDGKGWEFRRNAGNHLACQWLFVDEVSMLDTTLAAALLSACAAGTHVLLIGDPGQLPPIGHGAPLRDLITAGSVPVAELTEIRRNAGMIVEACRDIRAGRSFRTCGTFDDAAGHNLRLFDAGIENAEQKSCALFSILARLKQAHADDPDKPDPVWETQVIVSVNDKSPIARRQLNALMQEFFNAGGAACKPNPFRVNDKIICLKNSMIEVVRPPEDAAGRIDPARWRAYREDEGDPAIYIANGEIGRIVAVSAKQAVASFEERLVRIPIGNKKQEEKEKEEADSTSDGAGAGAGNFDIAYACTCHKLQGSEARIIIIMADEYGAANRVTSREWWYTAISRARQRCLIVGRRETIKKQCKKVAITKRKTFLQELIQETVTHG